MRFGGDCTFLRTSEWGQDPMGPSQDRQSLPSTPNVLSLPLVCRNTLVKNKSNQRSGKKCRNKGKQIRQNNKVIKQYQGPLVLSHGL